MCYTHMVTLQQQLDALGITIPHMAKHGDLMHSIGDPESIESMDG